jgi:3-deoxy-7-phosphoheptulonate synthase
MIVRMKMDATKENYDHITGFLKQKGFQIKDISNTGIRVFGIVGDTSVLDPHDLYAFFGVSEVILIHTPYKKANRNFKLEDTIVSLNEKIQVGGNDFLVIAGPCSVESYEQLSRIAKSLKSLGVSVLRAGAFKPRTSPYSFQGLGMNGLKILRRVADEEGLLVCSEIPSAEYLNDFEALVDLIQVGTRNMQNYHLLKALGTSKKPILLKRGLSATIEEWLMSAEYIMDSGNEQIILCERGIRTFEKYTRNTLDLSAVLAIKELSHLPVIVDPSHATGRWSMVPRLSMAAYAVGSHGLMVEVHDDPEHALSDGAQALRISKFKSLMENLNQMSTVLGKKII